MKARKLVQTDNYTNIVFFGSQGYLPKLTSTDKFVLFQEDSTYSNLIYLNLYFKKIDNKENKIIIYDTNYVGNQIIVDENDEIEDGILDLSNDNFEINHVDGDEYLINDLSEHISISLNWILMFNAYNSAIDEFIKIEESGTGNEFSIDNIIAKYKNLSLFSNFILKIESNDYTSQELKIIYYTKAADLVYQKTEITPSYNDTILYNYAGEQEGVKYSLVPRLSVIKGELWYKASYGLPILEKIKSKGIYDAIVINIILEHPDVTNIENFTSSFDKKEHTYKLETCDINTIYGLANIVN